MLIATLQGTVIILGQLSIAHKKPSFGARLYKKDIGSRHLILPNIKSFSSLVLISGN